MNYPIVISSKANVYYYTGLSSSNAMLIMYKNDKVLITDSRYEEAARNTGINVAISKGGNDLCDVALEILETLGSEIVAYEDYDMLAKDFLKFASKYKMMPVSDGFLKVRSKKDEIEVTKMLTASKIASKAYERVADEIKEGATESSVAALLDFYMRAGGAQGVSFDTIVAFGANASMPHHEPDNTPLKKGDCVLIDMGARFEGYCSDMTRTFFYGEPADEDKKIYEIVLRAQEEALNSVRDGVSCRDVDKVARSYIEASGYGDYFGHGLGHGVGLEIHEYPMVNSASEDILETGMVITIEPGIYLPERIGVRIEDMVLVTGDGHINLTGTDKKMKIK